MCHSLDHSLLPTPPPRGKSRLLCKHPPRPLGHARMLLSREERDQLQTMSHFRLSPQSALPRAYASHHWKNHCLAVSAACVQCGGTDASWVAAYGGSAGMDGQTVMPSEAVGSQLMPSGQVSEGAMSVSQTVAQHCHERGSCRTSLVLEKAST